MQERGERDIKERKYAKEDRQTDRKSVMPIRCGYRGSE